MPAGPVAAEYDKNGGSVVLESACLNGAPGGFDWRAPAKPVVTAAAVRAQAIRLVPAAAIGLAPKTATLVNIQTVLWIDTPTDRDLPAVRILGQHVTIHLTLHHVTWDFGDAQHDTTPTAGKAYNETTDPCRTRQCPDYYGHTYTTRGHRTLTATAYWTATFHVDTGGAQTVPGTVPGPPATATIAVKEARAVLTPDH